MCQYQNLQIPYFFTLVSALVEYGVYDSHVTYSHGMVIEKIIYMANVPQVRWRTPNPTR